MKTDHPLPKAFRRAFYASGPAATGVGLVAYHMDGLGLVVHVTTWPVGGYGEPWLRGDDIGPLFTARGETAWAALRAAADQVCGADALSAIVLHPDALTGARARYAQLLADEQAAVAHSERAAA